MIMLLLIITLMLMLLMLMMMMDMDMDMAQPLHPTIKHLRILLRQRTAHIIIIIITSPLIHHYPLPVS
jgi:hypothetical protein